MTDYKQLCAELVHIADALDGGTELASNQGQSMDGYSALAAFRDVAYRARAALARWGNHPGSPDSSAQPISVSERPARAVLTAVTLTKYDVPPEGLPAFAEEMAPLIAAALRAAVAELSENLYDPVEGKVPVVRVSDLLAIVDELEAQ